MQKVSKSATSLESMKLSLVHPKTGKIANGKKNDALDRLIALKSEPVVLERELSKLIGILKLPYSITKSISIPYELDAEGMKGSFYTNPTHLSYMNDDLQRLKDLKTFFAKHKLDTALIDANIEAIHEWMPLAIELGELKAKQKTQKEINGIAFKQAIGGRTNSQIKKAVDEIAELFRQKLEENYFHYYKRMVSQYNEFAKEKGTSDPYKFFPKTNNYIENQRNNEFASKLTSVLNASKNGYTVKSDSELLKIAIRISTDEAAAFSTKMSLKLGGLLPTAESAFQIKHLHEYDTVDSNTILFDINNGAASFYVQNTIVAASSKYGVYFHRFPTTFHNLVINGEKVKSPDELTVKNALNKAFGNGETVTVIKSSDLDARGNVKIIKEYVCVTVDVPLKSKRTAKFAAVAYKTSAKATEEQLKDAALKLAVAKWGEAVKKIAKIEPIRAFVDAKHFKKYMYSAMHNDISAFRMW